MKPFRQYTAKRIDVKEGETTFNDLVAVETDCHLSMNGKLFTMIICSPVDYKELCIGFLLTNGLIRSIQEIVSITVKDRNVNIKLKQDIDFESRKNKYWVPQQISSVSLCPPEAFQRLEAGMDISKISSQIQIPWGNVLKACRALSISAEIYKLTGGTHVAGIFDTKGNMQTLAEDTGRHNTLDKAVGKAVLLNVDLNNTFLSFSGRTSAGIVCKAARVGIPIVASLSSPTSTAIHAAIATGVTLIGFARGTRITIYTQQERILGSISPA